MLNSSGKYKKGRPTKMSQLQIQRILRPYFEQGISASVTSEKTGINIKTVCKYFDFWTQEISESEENDFFERQKKERTRIIVSLDNEILEVHKFLDDINDEIRKLQQQGKEIPKHLFSLRLDAIRLSSNLIEKKGSFAMQPSMDEAIEKKIQEMIRKHENTGSDS